MLDKIFETLFLELGQPIAHIRLTRPALVNRFDELAHVEFVEALQAVAADETVRVLVLSAEGKVFSAGGATSTRSPLPATRWRSASG